MDSQPDHHGSNVTGKNAIFVFPDGLTLGGVTTWSVKLCSHLSESERPVAVIEHPILYNQKLGLDLPPDTPRAVCVDQVHPNSPFLTDAHVADYEPIYRSVLPGTVIPNWSFGTYAACAAIAKKEPECLRVIGFAHTDEPEYYQWLTYYEPIIHRFVAVSQEIADNLSSLLPHRVQDIVMCPYAIDVSPTLDRSYSMSGQPLQLIYAGRMSNRQKRVFDLAKLVEILTNAEVNYQLRLIGDGDDKASLRRKIESLAHPARQRVTFETSLPPDQMPAAWRAADIMLLVSDYEGTSIAMLEAMAQGCVPIVTAVSGTGAVIQNGENGFCVPVGDVAQLAQIIKQLASDRRRMAQLGTNAHTTMRARFSYDDYVTWILQLVDEVWSQPARSWPADRPLLPRELRKINLAEISDAIRGDRKAFKGLLIKVAARSGLQWLHSYRHHIKRVLRV